ncbi:MAG: hypothetical protein AAGJ93_02630 [Bacteroidota bacterium]
MLAEGATIIPARANAFAQLIEMPSLDNAKQLQNVNGFDLSAFNQFRSKDHRKIIHLNSVNS